MGSSMHEETGQPDIHFFIGKGGVGKSTTSALTAITLAMAGRRTLLVSMDPAHNQRDLFETDFSEKPKSVHRQLSVKEVDTDLWIARYLKETQKQIQRTYIYESAFNLQKHFKVIQFSPGLEEYALLLAFEHVLNGGAEMDTIVFDMAPTALTLRFFSLPQISLVWLKELLSLRELICRKKEIIGSIRLGACRIGKDRVTTKIDALTERHTRLQRCFTDDRTHVHLVMNADRLSLAEALRIRKRLDDLSIAIDRVVVNKVRVGDGAAALAGQIESKQMSFLPLADHALVGLASLQAFAQQHKTILLGVISPEMPKRDRRRAAGL